MVPAIDHVEADRGVALIEDDSLEAAADDVVARQVVAPTALFQIPTSLAVTVLSATVVPPAAATKKMPAPKSWVARCGCRWEHRHSLPEIALWTMDAVARTTTTPFEAICATSPGRHDIVVCVEGTGRVSHVDTVLLVVQDRAVVNDGGRGVRWVRVAHADGAAVLAPAERIVADVDHRQVVQDALGAVHHMDAGIDAAAVGRPGPATVSALISTLTPAP